MPNSTIDTTVQSPPHIAAFLSRVLVSCLEIRSVWSMVLGGDDPEQTASQYELLAFADPMTLRHLRNLEDLHRTDVELLVVVDGDRFESAWGPRRLSGSLARWAWRQTSPCEAYYDESRWLDDRSDGGAIVRVRRKALLVWGVPAVH